MTLSKRRKIGGPNTKVQENKAKKKPLPVTVLSGFLGSGKTTLLRHILQSPVHGLRIAVIINDMASINIDADFITRSIGSRGKQNNREVRLKEKVVRMQNGCICCTLRSDLFTELARLAWSDDGFDHVIIESSGISEPQQIAETFTAELTEAMIDAEGMNAEEKEVFTKVTKFGGLKSIVSVDTMVTVVDAFRFFSEFDTAEFLQDRFSREEVPEEDQRTISDLFIDQIEFANVIIINKIDAVNKQTLGRVKAYAKTLNPTAKIIESEFAKVNVRELLNTGMFNFAEATTSPGWLRSLHEMTVIDVQGRKRVAPKPETLEYNIGSFVYRARRPFDPLKLYQLIEGKFILLQEEPEDDGENEDEDTDVSDDDKSNPDSASDNHTDNGLDKNSLSDEAILANKRASPYFAGLHRSKGIFWLATRPFQMGSWSTAGAMLTLGSEMPWFCCVPEEDWGADVETVAAIRKDFEGKWADRRQELVLIGEGIDVEGLTTALDACLLSKTEMKKWEKVMCDENMNDFDKEEKLGELWDDGYWAEWAKMNEEDHEGHHHH